VHRNARDIGKSLLATSTALFFISLPEQEAIHYQNFGKPYYGRLLRRHDMPEAQLLSAIVRVACDARTRSLVPD
jgi:hypothetical protein